MDNNHLLVDATRPTHVAFPTRLRVPPEAMDAVRLEDWLDPHPPPPPLRGTSPREGGENAIGDSNV